MSFVSLFFMCGICWSGLVGSTAPLSEGFLVCVLSGVCVVMGFWCVFNSMCGLGCVFGVWVLDEGYV